MNEHILLTGSTGFIGTHIKIALKLRCNIDVTCVDRCFSTKLSPDLRYTLIHAAGSHKPLDGNSLKAGNEILSGNLVRYLTENRVNLKKIVVVSTDHVHSDSDYGRSKKSVEAIFREFSAERDVELAILRFPRIFGPGSKPYTNSFIATIMHLARSEGAYFNFKLDDDRDIDFLYVSDAVNYIIDEVFNSWDGGTKEIKGTLLKPSNIIDKVKNWTSEIQQSHFFSHGSRIEKQLYAHLIYALSKGFFKFNNSVTPDTRGSYTTVVSNSKVRQIGIVRINPYQERGNHFHHSKLEIFSVTEGVVIFEWRDLIDDASGSISIDSRDGLSVIFPPFVNHTLRCGDGFPSTVLISVNESFSHAKDDTLRVTAQKRDIK